MGEGKSGMIVLEDYEFLSLGRERFSIVAKQVVIAEDPNAQIVEDRFVGDLGADAISLQHAALCVYQIYCPERDEPNTKRQEGMRRKISTDTKTILRNSAEFRRHFGIAPTRIVFVVPDDPDVATVFCLARQRLRYGVEIDLWGKSRLRTTLARAPFISSMLRIASADPVAVSATAVDSRAATVHAYMLRGHYRQAIQVLDTFATADANAHAPPSTLHELRIVCLQKLGMNRAALRAMRIGARDCEWSQALLTCAGKCYSQSGDVRALADVVGKSTKDGRNLEADARISSLLWRYALLHSEDAAASSALAAHRDQAQDDYQLAHNLQCRAIRGLFCGNQSAAGHTDLLHGSYLAYKNAPLGGYFNEYEISKCVLSNLLLFAVADRRRSRYLPYYKKCLFARYLFALKAVRPGEEAMAELGALLKASEPEAYAIVWGRGSLRKLIAGLAIPEVAWRALSEVVALLPRDVCWPNFAFAYESLVLESAI
jgi:hypothetical protein